MANYRKHLKCECCGLTEKALLCVHHIDKNRKNNDINNLETFCYNCHRLVHYFERKPKITILENDMTRIEFSTPIKNESFLNRLMLLLGYSRNNKILVDKDEGVIGWVCSDADMEDILKKKYKWPKRHSLPTMKDVLKMATTRSNPRSNQSENHSGDFRGGTIDNKKETKIFNFIKNNEGIGLLKILDEFVNKTGGNEARIMEGVEKLKNEGKIKSKQMRYYIA